MRARAVPGALFGVQNVDAVLRTLRRVRCHMAR